MRNTNILGFPLLNLSTGHIEGGFGSEPHSCQLRGPVQHERYGLEML
jgi:hypothetical protein